MRDRGLAEIEMVGELTNAYFPAAAVNHLDHPQPHWICKGLESVDGVLEISIPQAILRNVVTTATGHCQSARGFGRERW
jgi:hypothetical protein